MSSSRPGSASGPTSLTPATDEWLARRAALGDQAAFHRLVRRHEGAVRGFLVRLARDAATADDIAQDAFLNAWRHAAKFEGRSAYRSWLLGIAWKAFLTSERSSRRYRMTDQAAGEAFALPGVSPSLEREVRRALGRLEHGERAAVILCLGHGYSHSEAARILRMPLGSFKTRIARARRKLANELGEPS